MCGIIGIIARDTVATGLLEGLRQEFSLPVELLNPFQKIGYPANAAEAELIDQNAGQLAVAVGLALRSFPL